MSLLHLKPGCIRGALSTVSLRRLSDSRTRQILLGTRSQAYAFNRAHQLSSRIHHPHFLLGQRSISAKPADGAIDAEKFLAAIEQSDAETAARYLSSPNKERYVRWKSKSNQTALHVACIQGNVELVRMLIAAGAPLNAVNDLRLTPLHEAVGWNHKEVVALLLSPPKPQIAAMINSQDRRGRTALMGACELGDTAVVQLLLAAGAKADVLDKDSKSALFFAAEAGHSAIVTLLLGAAAGQSTLNSAANAPSRLTPLAVACYNGNTEAARVLLDAGAQLTILSLEGMSPLHLATRDGHTDTVKLLLSHPKSKHTAEFVNLADKDGFTALHHACKIGVEQIVRFLLAAGADPSLRAREVFEGHITEYNALHLATRYGHKRVAEALLTVPYRTAL